MRIVRARVGDRTVLARLDGAEAVVLAQESDHPAADVLREALAAGVDPAGAGTGETVAADDLLVLAPVRAPSKVIAVGLNYADHARESGMAVPQAPLLFAKTPNVLIGPDDPIRYRAWASKEVDYEAELAIVIGSTAHDVDEADALQAVFGYTAANDVSARDAQFADSQWTRGKSFDSFCPLGPVMVTPDELDPAALAVRCRVNGVLLQDGTTADMIFPPAALIAYISQFITLEPGDVVLTGTPFGVGFSRTPPVYLVDGDIVEVEIEGIGVLRNPVTVDG